MKRRACRVINYIGGFIAAFGLGAMIPGALLFALGNVIMRRASRP